MRKLSSCKDQQPPSHTNSSWAALSDLEQIRDSNPALLYGLKRFTRDALARDAVAHDAVAHDAVEGAAPPSGASEDKELSHVLDTLDEILQALERSDPEIRKLGEPLRRAVTRAVMQSLVDRELRSLALRDDLTGLYNRRAFLALATQQLRANSRSNQPSMLFFADVDGLKRINDSFGHSEGDVAIGGVANAIRGTFRESDIQARLGGDEFAVLAPSIVDGLEDVLLRRLSRNLRAAIPVESPYELSVSVGVAYCDPESPASLSELIEQADRSMYRRKKTTGAAKARAAAAR